MIRRITMFDKGPEDWEDDDEGLGSLTTSRGCLPLKALDVRAAVNGLVSEVSVRQTFYNEADDCLGFSRAQTCPKKILPSKAPQGGSCFAISVSVPPTKCFSKGKVQMSSRLRKCEVCRQWIAPERVATVPQSRLCIDHAWSIEDFGGEFKLQFYQERTPKAGSLKVNYGGIITRLVRNQNAMERLIERYEEEEFGNGVRRQPGCIV